MTTPGTAACTVSLNGPAPASGIAVSIASNTTALTVPATVTVPASATSVSFNAVSASVAAATTALLTARVGGVSQTASFQLLPFLSLSSLTCSALVLAPGASTVCTLGLTQAAPGGAVVTLSANSNVSLPGSVTVPAGAASAAFTLKALTSGTAVITAAWNGASVTAPVTITTVVPAGSAPAGYWTFDTADVSGNYALDKSGSQANLSLTGASRIAGRLGEALSFTGAAGSVYTANNAPQLDLNGSLTLAAWIRPADTGRNEVIVSKYDAAGSESGYIFRITPGGGLGLRLGGNNVSTGSRDVAASARVTDGQWHHAAVVIAIGQSVTFYVDGTAVGTQSIASAAARSGAAFQVGGMPGGYYGWPLTGAIDDVRVYSAALGASDLAALAGGSATPADTTPPTVAVTAPAAGTTVAGTITLSASAADDTGVAGVQFLLDGNNLGSQIATAPWTLSWNSIGTANGAHTIVAVASDRAGNRRVSASVAITVSNTSIPTVPAGGPDGYWTFDSADLSGKYALDKSGNAVNLLLTGTTATGGRIGQSLYFNGSDSSALAYNTGARLDLNGDLTVAAWIRTSNTSRQEVVLCKYDAAGSEAGYLLKTTPAGGVVLRVGARNLVAGNRETIFSAAVNDGQWHHIAFVFETGQIVKFYVDGALLSSQPLLTTAVQNGAAFQVGSMSGNYFGLPFTGYLDEVRIYQSALSGAQIAALLQ
jgi:hypothetical protein